MARLPIRILVATALAAACAAGLAGQGRVFRATTPMVPVYVTVTGPDGRLVTDLEHDDFRVFDNGREQPISLFDNNLQPISIVVMLDMSGSMTGNLPVLRSAAVQMFTRLLPGDRARVGSFGERIVISPEFTHDAESLIRSLWLDLEPGGPTPIWRAIGTAMTELGPLEGRRVVLVLSDGKSSTPNRAREPQEPTLQSILSRAEREEVMIYAIGMTSRSMSSRAGPPAPPANPQVARQLAERAQPDPALRELAAASGGGYFLLEDTADLGAVFARVTDELHRQYLISFVPPESDGRRHNLQVRVRHTDMAVRARQTYLAPERSR
jgi:VWFA-related protein